ncbi:MAG: helix-turn-helix domain-containing protein [Rubricoccaceae bacterium]|nr:helix-turn-helix domain-containing protein [Rubricoccaceae bacterium]
MSDSDAQDRVFKAIANADRRTILDTIRDQPRTTKEVCTALPHLDRTTVMLHLRVLEEADLVIVRRQGRYRWNYLNVAPIQAVYNRWIKDYAAPAAELLTRLKEDLERAGVGESETVSYER